MKIFSVVGYSNSGKTTLIKKISDSLEGNVSVIKHVHEFDKKGKDTDKLLRESNNVVAVSKNRSIKIKKSDFPLEESIEELEGETDYVILEGFKKSSYPKIVLGSDVEEECNGEIIYRLDKKPDFDEIKETVLTKIKEKSLRKVSLQEIIREIKDSDKIKEAGAIGSFTGIVRGFRGEKKVEYLFFEKFEEKSEDEINQIENKLKNRDGIVDARIHHKKGKLKVGDDIVYIVIASEHREELFKSLSDAIDLVKSKVPIWKKEVLVEGENWVHDLE
ncbi:MAG: Molybdopterin converting factor large subunit MoaE [Candidatus Methanohalarchaeum thermophilum]|uniref:Molybdopterin converting factor large subunit MoaE n=1 Tax=Methanohalarchaeum thermophilum TaxID=1903181 RepID=A0A1Q6DWB8_METT1|nr:MAG: Molybdopterin converting factor large subunit MoaE [Candidatus Methanohalarchaeum thermophilum]